MTFKDVEDSVDTFSGDDGKNIKQWVKDFEETANLCRWNDMQKTIYVKRLLLAWISKVICEVQGRTWKDIEAALEREFSQKIDSVTS